MVSIDDLDAYREINTKINSCDYDDFEGDAKSEFKSDLKKFYGVSENKKADLLFEKAWDIGHSSGYHEVLIHWNDLIDLIR